MAAVKLNVEPNTGVVVPLFKLIELASDDEVEKINPNEGTEPNGFATEVEEPNIEQLVEDVGFAARSNDVALTCFSSLESTTGRMGDISAGRLICVSSMFTSIWLESTSTSIGAPSGMMLPSTMSSTTLTRGTASD